MSFSKVILGAGCFLLPSVIAAGFDFYKNKENTNPIGAGFLFSPLYGVMDCFNKKEFNGTAILSIGTAALAFCAYKACTTKSVCFLAPAIVLGALEVVLLNNLNNKQL